MAHQIVRFMGNVVILIQNMHVATVGVAAWWQGTSSEVRNGDVTGWAEPTG